MTPPQNIIGGTGKNDPELIKTLLLLKEESMDKLRGYVYDNQGMHGDYQEFDDNPKNIANFIMFHRSNPVVITDDWDNFVVSSTAGGFLDRVASPKLREEIIKEILPLQMGEKTPFDPTKENKIPIEWIKNYLHKWIDIKNGPVQYKNFVEEMIEEWEETNG